MKYKLHNMLCLSMATLLLTVQIGCGGSNAAGTQSGTATAETGGSANGLGSGNNSQSGSGTDSTGNNSSGGSGTGSANNSGSTDRTGNSATGDTKRGTAGTRTTITSPLQTSADGLQTLLNDNGTVAIDLSHTENGYVMINYTGSADKVQIQITNPDGSVYPYPLQFGDFAAFPLTCGDGDYLVTVLEHVEDDLYAIGLAETISVEILDEFQPFLYPSQYISYTADSDAVKLGITMSEAANDDLEYIGDVYRYVTENVAYDNDFAANAPVNYIPDPDRTLASGMGICFDYASLMTAMLRSQNIPTKLQVGYSGEIYHAWISVYTDETGWMENIISFDGKSWTLVDPTLGANNSDESVKQYIGDGSHYTVKYNY